MELEGTALAHGAPTYEGARTHPAVPVVAAKIAFMLPTRSAWMNILIHATVTWIFQTDCTTPQDSRL
jgi:hypothetical protein